MGGLGHRRLKMMQAIMAADELDDERWFGKAEFHLGGNEVKVAILPAPTTIKMSEEIARQLP